MDEDPERWELVRRYVSVDRRYLRLGGSLMRLAGDERDAAVGDLAAAAAQITDAELTVLLDRGGWRERKTAAWLIAASDRQRFRPRLGELLLASEGPYAGGAYCVALAHFGTEADVLILCDYLDRYLRRPDLNYDQLAAMGALLCVDAELRTSHHARFMEPDGLWQQWSAAVSYADELAFQRGITKLVAFLRDCIRAVRTEAPPQQ